ncbi:MAG: peroxidase family protein [Burkholderiaceae bacterium]
MDFFLAQIKMAEQNAGYDSTLPGVALPAVPLDQLVTNPLLPEGLRRIDGTYNNVLPGQFNFGAADQVFPRMLPPAFKTNVGTVTFDPDGPGGQAVGQQTSYTQNNGFVFDAQPRLASNLVVDQTATNPAAVAAWRAQNLGPDNLPGTLDDPAVPAGSLFIANVATDVGLSAPYNSWFTLFGQFFDHGLDLTNKGGSGTVIIPLAADDPLITHGPNGILGDGDEITNPALQFMALTRASNLPGPDGILGNADDVHEHKNQTSPFVDQNQTYTSHPSHQVFLREYERNGADDATVATGRMIDGATGGIGNWGEVKAQAREMLGIDLTDADLLNIPMILTDAYGRFIPGANGLPQLRMANGSFVEGNLTTPISTAGASRIGHAFLDDIAHSANPVGDHDGNRATPAQLMERDTDGVITVGPQPAGTYDGELLDRHFITGDGRGNENIGLTTVHTIFHAEHNRVVESIKAEVLASDDGAFIAEWQNGATGEWYGERLFQAARFVTEMQYQHLVFEEFARKVQPEVNVFAGYSTAINPAIMAEFAHVVYRFGHSMLTETVDRIDINGVSTPVGLIEAFLNPVMFDASGANAMDAAGNIVRGMTQQVGSELDEFVTGALRNNLVGLPLDLAVLNMARARDTGVPSLNVARRMFYEDTANNIPGDPNNAGNPALKPYDNWVDFGLNLKHSESLVNFVAAYGTHASITGAVGMAAKRAAAQLLIDGSDGGVFMNSAAATSGLDTVDFWLGGLAEKQMVFGGLLGSTFNFVFETQLEMLQDGDRLYYLSRNAGLNFLTELEGNSFAALIERNLPGVKHLPGDVFSTPAFTAELAGMGTSGPITDDLTTTVDESTAGFIRMGDGTVRYTGVEHIVMGGTAGDDRMRSSEGDDTLHGDAGNDRLEGGDGNDFLIGGDGDDILTDLNGIDNIKGGEGNDVISSGAGLGDLNLAGGGDDFVIGGSDPSETFGGRGDDFIFAGDSTNTIFGNEGDDWIEGGGQADLLQGDMGDPFQASRVSGNDVIIGGSGNDDYDSESGDDIMVSDGGVERHEGMLGFDWVTYKGDTTGADADMFFTGLLPPTIDALRDRFDMTEGLSGWKFNDILRGTNNTGVEMAAVDATSGFNNALNSAEQISLIGGLQALLGAGVTQFGTETAGVATSGGDIILGGDGSDLMEGRAGDDIIHGDAWLNVRIAVESAGASPAGRAESMKALLMNAAGTAPYDLARPGLTLQQAMLEGLINPGRLNIVREIVTTGADAVPDTDTAVFRGARAEYTITTVAGVTTVAHTAPAVAAIDDGVDTLHGVERLAFTDQTISVGANVPTTGVARISDTTPTAGTAVTADTSGIVDPNGIASMRFQWFNGAASITTLSAANSSFTPTDGQAAAGQALRLNVEVTDGLGNVTTLSSVVATATGRLIAANGASQTLNGNAGQDLINGGAGTDTLNGNAEDDRLNGGADADTLNGGAGNDTLNGDAAADTLNGDAGNDTLDGGAGGDTLNGGADNDTLIGGTNGGQDTLNGGTGADQMVGGGGNDTYVVDNAGDVVVEAAGATAGTADLIQTTLNSYLMNNADGVGVENLTFTGAGNFSGTGNSLGNVMNGGGGNDTLSGLGGVDTLNGNGGNDTLLGGNGADILRGGTGVDTMTGGTGADTFDFNGVTETGIGAGARDIIMDFVSGTDKIDLRDFAPGTFGFLGTGAFTNAAGGQVRYQLVGTDTLVQIDNDNDAVVEAEILLQGFTGTLLASDFLP